MLVTIGALSAQRPASPVAFQTNADLVLVPMVVRDRSGQPVQGLRADQFTVFDDQNRQKIVSFLSEDGPCSVGLVLDTSGSMRNTLRAATGIVHAFLATANPDDEFLLLTVSTTPNGESGFTNDAGSVEKQTELQTATGLTALFDSIHLGLNKMRAAKYPRRALLIISDGKDNHSRYSGTELMRMAIEVDVQVYTILVENGSTGANYAVPLMTGLIRKSWDQGRDRPALSLLEALSDKTGGIFSAVRTDAEAKKAVIQSGEAIRREYVIGYQPANLGRHGQWHRVVIKSDLPRASIAARKGYYTP
jgi:Ca-activated chloride channel family protein